LSLEGRAETRPAPTLREVITLAVYETMMIALTFGVFILSLIGLVIVIVKNMKK